MSDEISYPLSAQSLPIPLYVVLRDHVVFVNATGVCMVRALSSDQLLSGPFSRFFQDIPAWLEALTGEGTNTTQPDARAIPAVQLVPTFSAGDSNEVVSIRLTVTPARFDRLPARQVVVHGLPLPLDAQSPGKADERVLSARAVGAALPHEHLGHLLSTLPSATSLDEQLHAALRALEAALSSALCMMIHAISGRTGPYDTQCARTKLALHNDHATHLPTAAQGESDIELVRIAPPLSELTSIELIHEANAPTALHEALIRVLDTAHPTWLCHIPAQHGSMTAAGDLLCLFFPTANPPDDVTLRADCGHYIAALVRLLRLESEYRRSHELRDQYRLMVNHLSEGVLTLSTNGRVPSYNRSAAEILRMSGASWEGRPCVALNDMTLGEDGVILPCVTWPSTLVARIGRTISNVVVGVLAGNGQIMWLRGSALPMLSPDGVSPHAVLVIFTDIAAERSTYKQLCLLETKNSLIGPPNCTAFIERLDARLALPSAGESTLLYIGLDRFKTVNEVMGHYMGNQVLNMTAQRIRDQAGQRALLVCLGSDQFCMVIDGPNAVDTLAQQVLDALTRPFTGGEREAHLSTDIDVATHPKDGGDATTLIGHAETAMYRTKEGGRNCITRYSRALGTWMLCHFTLNERMRRAPARGQVWLVYQPKYTLDSDELVAVRALMQWSDPELDAVSPSEFVDVAEGSGYILELGRWALMQACVQNEAWTREFGFTERMAVNVSMWQCDAGVIKRDVDEVLKASSMASDRLGPELTESVLLAGRQSTQHLLMSLATRGVRISLGDFGIGFSSLSYLRSLPIHNIKIDRLFISGVPEVSDYVALTKTIIAMARALNMTVTVEGVETPEQAAFLTAHVCDEVQGFLFRRSLEVSALEELLCT